MRLLLFCLLISTTSFAQTEPAKGVNVIMVISSLSDSALYKMAGKTLIESGFTISKADKDFMQIQTDVKKIQSVNSYSRLVVSIANGKVRVSGFFGVSIDLLGNSSKDVTPIISRGMKGSPFKVAFEQMNDYAKSLADVVKGVVYYQTL